MGAQIFLIPNYFLFPIFPSLFSTLASLPLFIYRFFSNFSKITILITCNISQVLSSIEKLSFQTLVNSFQPLKKRNSVRMAFRHDMILSLTPFGMCFLFLLLLFSFLDLSSFYQVLQVLTDFVAACVRLVSFNSIFNYK